MTPTKPPNALATRTRPKTTGSAPRRFRRKARRKVRKPTPPRITAMAVPANTMLGEESSARSCVLSGSAGR